ncbi:hypothetical protein DASC09_023820 [Saccharomycopsis crataegensis]|uniref:Micro-fibrillar-associated protein 1 C-terminal domain-containing protein n=1 Tax=Saccharomycopsis crataegensis TaxID=43959 RepID=A0AAV5QKB9_9ASCO|nr:hypothetical protein DASC09_023820 [Saccharomycopsis crataegensis]
MAPKKLQRYFPGKALHESGSSDEGSDSESSDEGSSKKINQKPSLANNTAFKIINIDSSKSEKTKVLADSDSDKRENKQLDESESGSDSEDPDDSNDSQEVSDDSNSDSDSDNNDKISQLIFVSKSKRARKNLVPQNAKDSDGIKDRALNYIEHQQRTEAESRKLIRESYSEDTGGIDDTDDLDPELEKRQWELRELGRLARDRKELELKEKEMTSREEVKLGNALKGE